MSSTSRGSSSRPPSGRLAYLDEAAGLFAEMLEGWTRQRSSRHLTVESINAGTRIVRRFQDFCGTYPWQWTAEDLEAFTTQLLSGTRPLASSTIRHYHVAIRGFCGYLTDPRYPWIHECETQFAEVPSQICHEWNTFEHLAAFEGAPARRPFDYDELQRLFDAADDRVEQSQSLGRKGALAALRDAQILKTAYAFGLRRREVLGLHLHDLRHNSSTPRWGRYAAVQVRFGKAAAGGPPQRRTVLAVPQFAWALDGLKQWVEEARPLYGVPDSQRGLWLSERRGVISPRTLESSFSIIRHKAGLPTELTLHSLRHSYVTHLIEAGYSARFVQDQVGHAYASTTAIYASVGDEYRQAALKHALAEFFEMGSE